LGSVLPRREKHQSNESIDLQADHDCTLSEMQRMTLAFLCGWSFFLGYAAGGLGILSSLQPGRFTLNLFVWCIPLTVYALGWVVRSLRNQLGQRVSWFAATLLFVGAAAALGPRFQDTVGTILSNSRALLPSDLPESHKYVLNWVKEHVEPGERIFFEERNRGYPIGPDPMAMYRLSGLIPLHHPVEVIGGPYLFAHLQTNFAQIGDGHFLGGRPWDRRSFADYAHLYGTRYIICWSDPARHFCRTNPDLVLVVEETPEFLMGRIGLSPGSSLKGEAIIHATLNQIHVQEARATDGELILRYHWMPGLKTEPPVVISARTVLDDPVPFISIQDPPREFVIRFDVWSLPWERGNSESK
jgi:hypothetical protein